MTQLLKSLDRLTRHQVTALAVCGVAIVGGLDYLTGYEVSLSFFYLGPVALAAWYGGRATGPGISLLSCASWYAADIAAGSQYSHPAIPVWNALIRLAFFLLTSVLLTALRNSLARQRHLAQTDGLTGLYGRRAFDERLRHDLAMAQRHRSPLTLAYVDLDDFKAVNDARGHAEGDRLLRAVGQVLENSVRETDTAARIGGDEFAVVFPDTDSLGAEEVLSKLNGRLSAALESSGARITCSIGVITFLDASIPPERAVASADELMYEVKRKGKGAVIFSVLEQAGQPPADAGRRPATSDPTSGDA